MAALIYSQISLAFSIAGLPTFSSLQSFWVRYGSGLPRTPVLACPFASSPQGFSSIFTLVGQESGSYFQQQLSVNNQFLQVAAAAAAAWGHG